MATLRDARILQHISQGELARRTQIARPTISAIEHGRVHPFDGWKQRIAAALNLDAAEIDWTRSTDA